MKKRIFVLISFAFFLIANGKVSAAPIDPEQALQAAREFYSIQYRNAVKSNPEFTCVYPLQESKESFVPYYIYNVGENEGFVILAGDDNATLQILGYSDRGHFEVENMPENLRSWLRFYEEGVYAASRSTSVGKVEISPKAAEVIVEPLLGTINYNQDQPYNQMCPIDPAVGETSYTGCVATALSSIAKFFEYPAKGNGSVSYVTRTRGIQISGDLSQSTYDWANIKDTYDKDLSEYTQAEKDAIALLMRDFGYAVKMDYSSGSSGAYADDAIYGVVAHMGFDSMVSYRERSQYDTEEEWTSFLKSGLDQGYPYYYQGASDGGGHAFVCDGYNSEDYFHFNWGWNGFCNGYYTVNYLDPGSYGIGGGTGGGYTEYQGVFHNLVPSGNPLMKDDYFLVASNVIQASGVTQGTAYDLDRIFTVYVSNINNYNMAAFDGSLALGVYADGEFLQLVSKTSGANIPAFSRKTVGVELEADLSGLADGEYELWIVGKSNREGSEWNKIHTARSGLTGVSYLPLEIANGQFTVRNSQMKVNFQFNSPRTLNFSLSIYSNGFRVGETQVSSYGGTVQLLKGTYDFYFSGIGFDTAYMEKVQIESDTTITVDMKELMCDPVLSACQVQNGNTVRLVWMRKPYDAQMVYPKEYVMWLDGEEVERVAPVSVSTTFQIYYFYGLSLGKHVVGVQSQFYGDVSNIISDTVMITSTGNELNPEETVLLSPNPSSTGIFELSVPRQGNLSVLTLDGRELFAQTLSPGNQTIDMSAYPTGMYIFRIRFDKAILVRKAIIR